MDNDENTVVVVVVDDDVVDARCVRLCDTDCEQKRDRFLLGNKIKWPIETAFAIHVLSILAFQNDVHLAISISIDFLIFCCVEATEAHHAHHLLFFGSFPFQIGFGNVWSFAFHFRR